MGELGPLFFLGSAALLTVPVTAFICRYRIAHKKSVAYGTMLAGSASATLFTFAWMCIHVVGCDLFTRQFWRDEFTIPHKDPPGMIWIVLGFVTIMCVLPALGVTIYYQAKSKHSRAV